MARVKSTVERAQSAAGRASACIEAPGAQDGTAGEIIAATIDKMVAAGDLDAATAARFRDLLAQGAGTLVYHPDGSVTYMPDTLWLTNDLGILSGGNVGSDPGAASHAVDPPISTATAAPTSSGTTPMARRRIGR